ncbi:16548_t:CDS:2, partial [Gigaspora rosea]
MDETSCQQHGVGELRRWWPLLDIYVVDDGTLLKKYDLKANDAIHADEKHKPLFLNGFLLLNRSKLHLETGGAVQNVARGTQVNCYVIDIIEGANISQGSYPVTAMQYVQAN